MFEIFNWNGYLVSFGYVGVWIMCNTLGNGTDKDVQCTGRTRHSSHGDNKLVHLFSSGSVAGKTTNS